MKTNQALLQSYTMGDLNLKNRVVMAPMTRSRATNDDTAPTDMHVEYYTQRASAGLIITEGSQVSQEAVGYIYTAGIHNKAQVEGWKKVVQSIHDEGGKVFIQLWHVGRMSHPDFHNGDKPLAPSAVNPDAQAYTHDGFKDTVEPKAMSLDDIKRTQEDFVQAAKNAKEAGFDGVEIHASNGYLFHQFFNKKSNIREDNYGGSKENRSRFFFETLDKIKEVWPANRIGVRLNPSLNNIFGIKATEESIPTFDYIIDRLNDHDLAYLHLSEPFNDVSDIDFLESNIAKRYRPMYKGTLMINAGFDQESGNEVIDNENADLVSYGKLYVSNPDLVERFALNAHTAEWDEDTFYSQGKEGYLDYPTLKEETQENS
ncbi:MAG: alkene reductase [Leeuwenhoekiella sp.]